MGDTIDIPPPPTDPATDDLIALQVAVEAQAWPDATDALERLLERLPSRVAVLFAVEQLRLCLPIFEQYRPKIGWPRAAIDHLATAEALPEEFDFSPEVEGANPIVRHFLDGLDYLDVAAADQEKRHVCAVECAKAVLNTVHVQRYEQFARLFPRDWRLVIKREAGEVDLPPLHSTFMNEPVIVRYTADLWNKVGAALDQRLHDAG